MLEPINTARPVIAAILFDSHSTAGPNVFVTTSIVDCSALVKLAAALVKSLIFASALPSDIAFADSLAARYVACRLCAAVRSITR